MGALDRLSAAVGKAASWLTLVMVIVTFVIVLMRYVFDFNLIWMQESVTWMHAAAFMLGAAYTLRDEEHVRVDIIYRKVGDRQRAWIDLLGVFIFLLPMCLFLAYKSWDFVAASWSIHEASPESGGLPYPMRPILKTVLIIMPVAVALQGLSLALNSLRTIRAH